MTVATQLNAREIARRVLIDLGGDRNRAFDALQKRAARDSEFEKAIRAAVPLDTLLRDILGDAAHGLRSQGDRMAGGASENYSASQAAALMYLRPLHNGTPLRLATRADLLDDIQAHQSKVEGHRFAISFDRKVLQHLADEQTQVEVVLTPDALLELSAEAAREVGR